VVAGDEDAPGDFGGGLASSGDDFVVGLAP